jgi:general secretion pathway protein A
LKEPGLEPRAIDSVDSQSPVSEPAAPETPRSETSSLQLPIPPIPSEDENSADGAEDQKADTAVSSSDPIKPTREQTPTAKDATAPSDSPTPPVSHAPRRVDSTPTPPMPTREARKEITEALSDIISAVERSAVEEAAVTRPTPPEHADESKTETPAEQSAAKAAEPDAPPKPAEAKPASTPKRIPEPEAADAPPRPRRATPTAKPTNDDYVRRAAPLPGNFYQDWFGFEHMPFNNTPDPGFFFPTEKHQEALSRLIYAISERKGFVLITGEIGSGKSTLCRTLLAQLPRNVKTALITHTHIDPDQLVKAIAEDLGLDVQNANKYECLQKINECLIEELAAGNTVCIIIDEAQNLSPAALEEVRMISNLETEREKLVQLILLGQPELRDKVNLPSMLQLRQRISVQYHLQPLTHDETVEYISHRLRVAAPAERLEFERRTMHEVYNYTGGIPRLINTLCDNALLTAYTRGWRVVSPSIIREAAADLELQPLHGGWRAFCRMW